MSNIKLVIDEKFPAEKALRKFKRLCDSYGVVKEYKLKKEYRKPSVRKKEKLEQAEKRRRKAVVKQLRTRSKI